MHDTQGFIEKKLSKHQMPQEKYECILNKVGILTGREYEIAVFLSHGITIDKIAEIYDIAPRTVRSRIYTIYGKLGLDNLNYTQRTVLTRVMWDYQSRKLPF